MNRQSGFLGIPTLYLWLAALAVIAGLMLTIKVQSARLGASEANLEACASRYAETLKNVTLANKRVDELAADSAKRARNAAAALAKAREGQTKLDSEIARLRGLSAAGLDCSGAVAEVKRGMAR